jgi:tetratricopeptide (TPR) repeat protein
MHVLVQKDVGSRWLNRFVVLILLAIIAIQLSTYLKQKNDVAGEEARAATVIDEMRRQHERELGALAAKRVQEKAEAETQHERELGALAAKRVQEKAEADTQLEGLSRKISELQSESDRKLAKLATALDQQKQESSRQVAEHSQWLGRMADEIAKSKRDPVIANGGAKPVPGVNLRFVIPARIAVVRGDAGADANGQRQPRAEAEPPVEPAPDYVFFFKLADDFYRAEKYAEAGQIYSDLIERYPKAKASYLRRGDCFGSLQLFDKAIADFTTAIAIAPDDPRAYLARSWAYLGKGATDRAMADADEALRLEPTLAEAHRIRSEVFARKGQPVQAGAARAEGLAVLYRRGVNAIANRDYEAGIADLERVIRQAPNDAEAHSWCAKAHYLRSDFPKAVKEYTEVIALAPNDKESYNNRGMASFRMGAHGSAIADFDQAIGLDGKYSDAYLNRGTVRLALGDAERAAQDFSKVLELEPRDASEAYRLRSAAYASMGWAVQAASDRRIAERLGR